MTESEALKFINERIDFIKANYNNGTADYREALELSAMAIDKQIPKKPVEMKSTDKLPQGYFACPICGGWVGMDEYLNKFCAGCGQAIDWSEQLSLYEIEHGRNFKGNKNTRKTHDKRTRVFNQLNQTLVNKTLVEKGKSNDV